MADTGRRFRVQLDDQSFRYLVATVLSAGLSVSLPVLLHEVVGFAEQYAVLISQVTVLLMNFVSVKFYVFRRGGESVTQFVRFIGSSLFFRAAEYGLFLALFQWLGLHYILALLIALSLSFVVKYFVHRHYVFR